MSKIDEMIAKLPEELQPIALKYIRFFVDSAESEILAWINSIIDNNWQDAYTALVKKMSTEDLIAEQKAANERMGKIVEGIEFHKFTIQQALIIALELLIKGLIV